VCEKSTAVEKYRGKKGANYRRIARDRDVRADAAATTAVSKMVVISSRAGGPGAIECSGVAGPSD
jgi:hypothetical protein